eukprot:1926051-Rhodomonas_salina.3
MLGTDKGFLFVCLGGCVCGAGVASGAETAVGALLYGHPRQPQCLAQAAPHQRRRLVESAADELEWCWQELPAGQQARRRDADRRM